MGSMLGEKFLAERVDFTCLYVRVLNDRRTKAVRAAAVVVEKYNLPTLEAPALCLVREIRMNTIAESNWQTVDP